MIQDEEKGILMVVMPVVRVFIFKREMIFWCSRWKVSTLQVCIPSKNSDFFALCLTLFFAVPLYGEGIRKRISCGNSLNQYSRILLANINHQTSRSIIMNHNIGLCISQCQSSCESLLTTIHHYEPLYYKSLMDPGIHYCY